MRKPSTEMATMGERMTALGETDFMTAQTRPARQNRPRWGQSRWPATRIPMPMPVRILPVRGTRALCRKLPKTISEAAQRLPSTAALRQSSVFPGRLMAGAPG